MKTIGILLHQLDDNLARAILRGLNAKAAQNGVRLVYFPGRHLHTHQLFNRQFNVVFDLACRVQLDGVLAIASAFQAGAYEEEVAQVFSLFRPTPLIALNFIGPDNPAVIVDNRSGMEQLFNHLIYSHGYRRIAYMRGTDGHFDEEERFAAYLAALERADIPFSAELVVQGNFEREGGWRAMEELLAREVKFDALVCANDEMALAALTLAGRRHLHVPGDFAICGFDNFLSTDLEAPPITTVEQPIEQQLQVALELLLKHVDGDSIPLITKVPTRLIVRHSCGCIGERLGMTAPVDSDETVHKVHVNYRDRMIAALHLSPARAGVYRSYLLFLEHCLHQPEHQPWMDVAIGEFAMECLVTEGDISHLQSLVFYIQQHLLDIFPRLRTLPAAAPLLRYTEQLQKWQIVIVDKLRGFQLDIKVDDRREREALSRFVKTHLKDFSLDSICELLQKTMRYLQVENCALALYNHSFDYQLFGVDIPSELRLVLVLDEGAENLSMLHKTVALRDILCVPLWQQRASQSIVVLPIFQHNRHVGILLLDISRNPGMPLEWLHHEISSILVGAIWTEELQQQRKDLQRHLDITNHQNARLISIAERDELTGLLNRRGFFHRAPVWVKNNAGREMVLLFIDLDDLKKINDAHGHSEGDMALTNAAAIISSVFRSEDLICRMSGDEFVVLSAGYAQHRLDTLKARLYDQFEQHNKLSDYPYVLGCSLGAYLFKANDTTPLDEILAKADEALYEEKQRRKAGRTS